MNEIKHFIMGINTSNNKRDNLLSPAKLRVKLGLELSVPVQVNQQAISKH